METVFRTTIAIGIGLALVMAVQTIPAFVAYSIAAVVFAAAAAAAWRDAETWTGATR